MDTNFGFSRWLRAGALAVSLVSFGPVVGWATYTRTYEGTGSSEFAQMANAFGTEQASISLAWNTPTAGKVRVTVTLSAEITGQDAIGSFAANAVAILRLTDGTHGDSGAANGTVLINWINTAGGKGTAGGTFTQDLDFSSSQWYRVECRAFTDYVGMTEQDMVVQNYRDMLGGATEHKIYLRVPSNPTDVPVKYKLCYNGTPVPNVEWTQQPGAQAVIQPYTVPVGNEGSGYTVVQYIGAEWSDGGGWVLLADGVFVVPPSPSTTTIPANMLVPATEEQTESNTVNVSAPTPMPAPGTIAKASSGGAVWRASTDTTAANILDKVTYREGVDKVIGRLDSIKSDSGAIKTATEALKTGLEGMTGETGIIGQATAKMNTMSTTANQATMEAAAAEKRALAELTVDSSRAIRGLGKGGSSDGPGTAGSIWEIKDHNGQVIANFDPMIHAEGFCAFVRGAFAWTIVVIYEWWLWGQIYGLYRTVSGANQTQGLPWAMGTGAQISALAIALTIVTLLVSIPGVFWALADSGLTVDLDSNPVVGDYGATAGAKYLWSVFVPTGTLVTIGVQAMVVRKGLVVMTAGISALIRLLSF